MLKLWRLHQWLAMKPLCILPFLIVGFGLWAGTAWLTHLVLSSSQRSVSPIQTNVYPTARLSQTLIIVSIEAKVNHSTKSTEVTLETTNSALNRMEFEYPLVEPRHLETALVNELGLLPQSIHSLIRYQVD